MGTHSPSNKQSRIDEIRRRGPPLPSASQAYADSGYQGLQDDHSGSASCPARYRYPRDRYAVKISNVAGILNIAAGFERQPFKIGEAANATPFIEKAYQGIGNNNFTNFPKKRCFDILGRSPRSFASGLRTLLLQ